MGIHNKALQVCNTAQAPAAAAAWLLQRCAPQLLRSLAPATGAAAAVPRAALDSSPDMPGTAAAPTPELNSGDWNALFDAVLARLRDSAAAAAEAARSAEAAPAHGALVVGQCVQALQQLQQALAQERAAGRHKALALAEVQAVLVAARLELAGTREGERRAQHLAQHDSLTALPNRRCFGARLHAELQTGAEPRPALAVLFVDLDGFKAINDRHGHAAGDRMLCIVADRLRRALRVGDMVGRIGGDEFACLLQAPQARPQLAQLACKLFDAVSAPLGLGALQLRVQPSIGIALCPEHGDSAAALLQHADAAMYAAKRRQSGHAFFAGDAAVA